MLFIGDDWAEAHHDIEIQDETGKRLAAKRLPEGMAGIAVLHELVGAHSGADNDPSQVVVGIETDRGPWVRALLAAGYQVFAINPFSASRYRERHTTSGAKSDPGDAKVLADIVRTDRGNHRPVAGDTELAEAIKVLARAHQSMGWLRGKQSNMLRSALRDFYPAALQAFPELTHADAIAVLGIASTPAKGRALSTAKIVAALRRGGRLRRLEARAAEIQATLRVPQLEQPPLIASAFGAEVTAYVSALASTISSVTGLEAELGASFGRHPSNEIYLSQPGLGQVLGARVLAEFGDDPTRYDTAKNRKNYAGSSPITKASGKSRIVLARVARNRRLADAIHQQAFTALNTSPGARAYYDARRATGATHHQALRAVSNRLVGILHGCLRHNQNYNEAIAWNHQTTLTEQAAA